MDLAVKSKDFVNIFWENHIFDMLLNAKFSGYFNFIELFHIPYMYHFCLRYKECMDWITFRAWSACLG